MTTTWPRRENAFHPGFVASGFLTLLGSAYLDCIRGPLLPVISQELGIPYSDMGWFLTIGSLASIFFVLALLYGLNRVAEKSIALGMCALAMTGSAFAFAVGGMWTLLALGIMLGGTIAVSSSMCNVLTLRGTPVAHRGRALAGQHVMYGLGCLLAPVAVAEALRRGVPWPWLIGGGVVYFGALGAFIFAKVPTLGEHKSAQKEAIRLTPLQLLVVLIYALYVAGEVLTSMWMTTFLKEARNVPLVDTALPLMTFFGLMATTRFLCFLFLKPRHEKAVILGCILAAFAAFMLSYAYWPGLMGLCGVLGPFYPVFLGRVSRAFPDNWRALSIWVNVAVQVGLGVFHVVVGRLTDSLGIGRAYLIAPSLLIVTFVCLTFYFQREGRRETENRLAA